MTRSGNGGDCGRTFRCCSALEPAVEGPVLPHKIDFSLVQLELGFEQFDGAGSLLQASVLLVLGRHQLTGRASAGGRELQQDGLQLLLREIAIDRGQLDARRKLIGAVLDLEPAVQELVALILGIVARACGWC